MIKNWFKNIGPGPLVAAAFIGPGTVTVCTLAGVGFGFSLLWAMLFSIIATIVLQEMSARLGIITQKGLPEIIKDEINNPLIKQLVLGLIIIAIVLGNAAYEAGNISGGVLGIEAVFESYKLNFNYIIINGYSLVLGFLAFLLLYFGNYKILEKVLITLVIIMSISFLITAISTKPDIVSILKGLFSFKTPKGSLITIIGLIGTTVVPYNIFLHSYLVKEKWSKPNELKYAVKDTYIAVILGGVVSISIIVSAASIQTQNINNATDLALGLEPLFGSYSKYLIGIGMFAAGLTSAITAPLAGAYVANGCLGWNAGMNSKKFRFVWMFILSLGIIVSSFGFKPIEIIKFAQFTNGLLLPLIAGILIWIINKQSVLGDFKNSPIKNYLAFSILIITIGLGLKSVLSVLNIL